MREYRGHRGLEGSWIVCNDRFHTPTTGRMVVDEIALTGFDSERAEVLCSGFRDEKCGCTLCINMLLEYLILDVLRLCGHN